MKIRIITAIVMLGALFSFAGCDQLRVAVWHGLKNTGNDLNEYTIPDPPRATGSSNLTPQSGQLPSDDTP